jgi:serine/threonine-protein kinase
MQSASYGEGFLHAPPEWIKKERVDERSEVYAFGSLLYELSTGEPPFGAYTEALIGHLTREPPRLGSPLDVVVRRAMQKDPAQRFGDLRSLVAALAA